MTRFVKSIPTLPWGRRFGIASERKQRLPRNEYTEESQPFWESKSVWSKIVCVEKSSYIRGTKCLKKPRKRKEEKERKEGTFCCHKSRQIYAFAYSIVSSSPDDWSWENSALVFLYLVHLRLSLIRHERHISFFEFLMKLNASTLSIDLRSKHVKRNYSMIKGVNF